MEELDEVKRGRPRKNIEDSDLRVEKLEADVKKIKSLLHKMSTAIGLPRDLLPPID